MNTTRSKAADASRQSKPDATPRAGRLLQRKCACGGTPGPSGECEACRKKRLSLQRRTQNFEPETLNTAVAPSIVHEVLRSPGQPLDAGTRAFMEPRFGHDFSRVPTQTGSLLSKLSVGPANDAYEQEAERTAGAVMQAQAQGNQSFAGQDFSEVRVHTDARAAESARAVNALAYTVGRDIVFGAGQYAPGTSFGRRLLAHELTHVVQQGGSAPFTMRSEQSRPATAFHRAGEKAGSPVSGVLQRAGDPTKIPPGFDCPTDLTSGRPAGTDVPFPIRDSTITPTQTALLTTFRTSWLASGGADDILVHGYASTDGDQALNWTLSCDRAKAVREELVGLGIPRVRISIVAHGASSDFGPTPAANRHAVVSTSAAGIIPLPLLFGTLTAVDNFAGRSPTRFGAGEVINLGFASLPSRPAADFGGLQWFLVSGGGALTVATTAGTAVYTAPATAGIVQLELRVAGGATAGRVISTQSITIVIPSGVRMTAVAGTAPGFSLAGPIPAGTWGAGFQANVFVDPRDVSFQGVVFGEGTVASVVSGSFQGSFVHPVNTFGPGHAGNAATGTPVSPPVDNIVSEQRAAVGTLPGFGPFCGASDFLWAIPWEFTVPGGIRTPFAGGFTANHHATSTFSCEARIEKGGAGPFCRRIDGTTC